VTLNLRALKAWLTSDNARRAYWTLAQAAVGYGITVVSGIDAVWSAPIAAVLSAAKSWIGQRIAAAKALRR